MYSAAPQHCCHPYPSAYVSIRQHTSAYVIIHHHTSAYVSVRQRTSAFVYTCSSRPCRHPYPSVHASIRQHRSAYVSIRKYLCIVEHGGFSVIHIHQYVTYALAARRLQHPSASVSIRQHTSAYVSIRQHTSAYIHQAIGKLLCTTSAIRPAYVSIRQHASAYVRILASCRTLPALSGLLTSA